MNFSRLSLLVLSVFAFASCATHAIPTPQPNWAQATGQIQTTGGRIAIVAEIAVRHDAANFLAEISKGPGAPLMRIYAKGAHGEQVTVRGDRGSWSGSPSRAPKALQAFAALPEVFQWAQAQRRGDTAYALSLSDVQAAPQRSVGGYTVLEYQRNGEKVVARFQP